MNERFRARISGIVLLAAISSFAAMGFFAPSADATTNRPAANIEGFRPTLAINIPTISFSGVRVDSSGSEAGISGYIDIPWIGEYMRGIYSYAVVAASLIAGVMIVVGGFYYLDRKSTRLNSSHLVISYAVFCLRKKKTT